MTANWLGIGKALNIIWKGAKYLQRLLSLAPRLVRNQRTNPRPLRVPMELLNMAEGAIKIENKVIKAAMAVTLPEAGRSFASRCGRAPAAH